MLESDVDLLEAYSARARINQYLVERLHRAVWRPKDRSGGRVAEAVRALGQKRRGMLHVVGAALEAGKPIRGFPVARYAT